MYVYIHIILETTLLASQSDIIEIIGLERSDTLRDRVVLFVIVRKLACIYTS